MTPTTGRAAAAVLRHRPREITGLYASDGDTSVNKVLGTDEPHLFQPDGHWRAFWTQQHGDNNTWELLSANN